MNNEVYLIDCMKYMETCKDKQFDLAIVDPPYNIKKDSWDSWKNPADYIEFMVTFFKELQRIMKDNSSVYLFHNDFNQLSKIQTRIDDETNLILRQFIIWNKRFMGSPMKGYFDGHVAVSDLRNYKKMAEYICFYTFQDETGLSKIMGDCVYPIRDYIRNEIIRAKGKIVLKEINKILGTATNGGGVASSVLSIDKTVPAMITEEHYNILREWLNNGEYEYLRKEYEYLRKEYEDLRYTFNNQKNHHSVWNYDIEESWHPTPKPRKLIHNILMHSANKNSKIFCPFSGSEITRVLCHDMGLNYIGCENNKKNFEAQEARYQAHIAQSELFGKEEIQGLIYENKP